MSTPSPTTAELIARATRALELSRETMASSRLGMDQLRLVRDIAHADLIKRGLIPDRRAKVRAPTEQQQQQQQ